MDVANTLHSNDQLRQERIRHNWRQQDLADQLGTTAVTVRRWERGSQQPSAYFRIKLCALFGKSSDAFSQARRIGRDTYEFLSHRQPCALDGPVSAKSLFYRA